VARLGTLVLTLTGGEPLLHPELDRLIARASSQGVVCTMISNGYPITREWIRRLNAAKLSLLQMSVDNMVPNEFSQKSWSQIRKKLDLLKEHATFGVNINAVLGSSNLEQTRQVVASVRALGFYMTVGLMHDGHGQLDAGLAGDELAALYRELREHSRKTLFHLAGEGWELEMIRKAQSPWKCRAGARYLYVDEHGAVSYCSQRRGDPGTPLLDYGRPQLRAAFDAVKGCEAACTIACVRRASAFDEWRAQSGSVVPVRSRGSLPIVQ
jgi:MoaA/NifB/PqqE/SkfB family radical SAM enzyme